MYEEDRYNSIKYNLPLVYLHYRYQLNLRLDKNICFEPIIRT